MKKHIRNAFLGSVLFIVLGLILLAPSVMQAQFNYTITNGTITITGYTGRGGVVIIPSAINGLPVTSIARSAFYGSVGLTSVTIPNSVTDIEAGFEFLSVLGAFADCTSLTNVIIGNSVTNIGSGAFGGCTRLASVTIGNSVTRIGGGAFYGCTSLTNVTIPNSVTDINEGPRIPPSGSGLGAFGDCTSLANVTIGSGLTNIWNGTFSNCTNLTAIAVDALNPSYSSLEGVLFNKSQTTLIQYPGSKAGASYTIPSGVTSIGDYAFIWCTGLTSVTIPNSVTNIGNGAFEFCIGLTSVTIPNSVTSIGEWAFWTCTSLASVVLPNSVTSIGDFAFYECSSLASVTFPNSLASIGQEAFMYCSNLTSVTIPFSVTSIGDYAFNYCPSLTSIYLEGNAPSVGYNVFYVDNNTTVYYLPGTTGWGPTFGGLPTALWLLPYPLILKSGPGFGVKTNQFGFIISWARNVSVVVEASTNLVNPIWSLVATNTLTSGSSYFSDPQWSNYPSRFYRLRWP